MGGNAPTWDDQWGASGPFSHEEDYDKPMNNKGRLGNGSKMKDQVKAVASTGLDKAKTAAVVGAKKVKTGTSTGFKWLKNKYSSNSKSA